MFGGEDVFGSLTVADNLLLGNWLGRSDDEERVADLFPELARRRDTSAGSLSGGERQMLTVALALLNRPSVLLIDELTLGLAPSCVTTLKHVLRRLADEGVAVLVVEQSADVVADIADVVVEMERGRIVVTRSGASTIRSLHPVVEPMAHDTMVGSDEAGSSQSVLAMSGVSVRFGGLDVVIDVELELGPRELLGIIGPNGAGKTTLLDTCSGFNPAACGAVHLHGRDVTRLSPSGRSSLGLVALPAGDHVSDHDRVRGAGGRRERFVRRATRCSRRSAYPMWLRRRKRCATT